MTRRALLIVNRHARLGADQADRAAALLRDAGLDVTEAAVEEGAGPSDAIRRRRAGMNLVVVGGGDGTLSAAAEGLLETGLPLGILPLGTANDLARTLGIPTDLGAACRIIADGHMRTVDLGEVNGKHFFNAASLGLSVEIAQRLTKEAKGRWGVFAYLATTISVLRHARPFSAEIRCGGDVHRVRTVQITIGNGRYFGGGLTVAEDAAIDDGELDIYSLEVDHWWQLLPLLPSMRSGTVGTWPRVRALKGREVEIIPKRRSRPINTDGEVTTATPAKFRVIPRAVSVFAPAPVSSPISPTVPRAASW